VRDLDPRMIKNPLSCQDIHLLDTILSPLMKRKGIKQTYHKCKGNQAIIYKTNRRRNSLCQSDFYEPYESHPIMQEKCSQIDLPYSDLLSNLSVVSIISESIYGTIYLLKNSKSQQLSILKKVSKKLPSVANMELHILSRLKTHPFIVNFYGSFETSFHKYFWIQYLSGRDLFFHINQALSMDTIRLYAAEIACALNHIHKNGFVYCDLKPENILIADDGHIKLIDFGLVKSIEKQSSSKEINGTPEFMSPEMVLRQKLTPASDWWAFGILIFEMIFKRTPFYCADPSKILKKITSRSIMVPNCHDRDAEDLIYSLVKKDPSKRLTFNQITQHPFFASLDFQKVLAKAYVPNYIPPKTVM
jgi:serine/threonine protein kinase